jgi:uncharacterized phage protein (TIGR01671 family)
MREIKFRAWDREDKKYIFDNVQFSCSCLDLSCDGYRDFIGWGEPEAERFDMEQFTGLHDKNGIEIYEGDVVSIEKHYYEGEWIPKMEGTIVFEDGCFQIQNENHYLNKMNIIIWGIFVIGNIHDEDTP